MLKAVKSYECLFYGMKNFFPFNNAYKIDKKYGLDHSSRAMS